LTCHLLATQNLANGEAQPENERRREAKRERRRGRCVSHRAPHTFFALFVCRQTARVDRRLFVFLFIPLLFFLFVTIRCIMISPPAQ
jgi:hypothetical protein